MIWMPSNRLFVARLVVVGLGVGLVFLLYGLGFPNVGAVSALAGLYVVVLARLRAGEFSTSRLKRCRVPRIDSTVALHRESQCDRSSPQCYV
jgi:MFS superfamily sulfate permease-like transporter